MADGRRLIALCLLAVALCLALLRLWFGEGAEEWRLRRMPLAALEQRAAAGQADFHAALILGERLVAAGRYEEAERVLRKLIEADPQNWPAYVQLGTVLAHTGRQQEAFQVLMIPVSRSPGLAEAHRALGELYLARQSHRPALRELLAAVRLESHHAETWYQLSQCYDAMTQPTRARQALEQAMQDDPREDRYPVELARLLRKAGQMDRAREFLARALALNPTSAPAHYMLGELLAASPDSADQEKAAAEFRAVLRSAPGYPPARYQLGLLAMRQGNAAAAAGEFEAALRVSPGFEEAAFNLARAYDRLGRAADARREQALFARLSAQEQQILDLRARIGFGGDDPATYLRLARAYRAAGQPDRAYDTLVSARQRFPSDPAVRTEWQAVGALTGRKTGAE
jgi:tetratricopeptide (TPR) repeat protein